MKHHIIAEFETPCAMGGLVKITDAVGDMVGSNKVRLELLVGPKLTDISN